MSVVAEVSSKPMTIAIIQARYSPYIDGGAERSTQRLAEGLASRGDRVHIITVTPDAVADREVNGVHVHSVPSANLYYFSPTVKVRSTLKRLAWHLADLRNPVMLARVQALLRRIQPDVVHTNILSGFSTSVWIAAHRLRLPIVHTIRDFYLMCIKSTMVRNESNCVGQCLSCRISTIPRKSASAYVTSVVGVSQYMVDSHVKAGYFSKAKHREAILNACPSHSFGPYPGPPKDGPITFGYIGRLNPTKGVHALIEACRSLACDGWRLVIAGRGTESYESHLRTIAAGLPITFLGEVTQSDFYLNVDLVVVPSLWNEPQPRTVLESFSFGRAVLASKRGGVPEIIHHLVNGLLFEPDNEGEFANRLQMVLNERDLLSQLATGAAACAHLVDEEHIIKTYRKVYSATVSTVAGQ